MRRTPLPHGRGPVTGVLALLAAATCLAQSALDFPALDFPMSMAVSPDRKFVLVLNAGAKTSISVMTPPPLRELSRVAVEDAWLGLVFAPDGKTVYAGGGGRGSVYEFSFSPEGVLKFAREMKASDFIGDVALSPDGRLLYAADLYKNTIVVINPRSGRVIDQFKSGRRPYRILFHPDRQSYFVSSWADASVYQYSVANGEEIGRIRLGSHTTDMVLSDYQPPVEEGQEPVAWKYRLFVAAANTNSVFAVGIGANNTMRLVDTINIAPDTLSPLGMTPSALALTADQKKLFVACSDADAMAVLDVSDRRGVLEEFIPTGAYPTAVRVIADRVVTVNGYGGPVQGAAFEAVATAPAPKLRTDRHVVYRIPDGDPVQTMRAMAGIAPDYTVKLAPAFAAGRRKTNDFDGREPANSTLAGYIWTNARAAGLTVRIYGISELGQIMVGTDWTKSFMEDLKGFEAGRMPNLIVIPGAAASEIDAALGNSKLGSAIEVVAGDLRKVENLLGLRPMTRKD